MTASDLERLGRANNVYFTAADLMRMQFPEPRWAVPGLVPEGLSLLVGAPNFGKSFMCLGLAIAIASGGLALGKVKVDQGAVLYAALEDTPRRLQGRPHAVLDGDPVPDNLHITTLLPRLPDAGDYIAGWLDDHPDARLVIVDVLRKVRPPQDGHGNAYNEDYDSLSILKRLADQYGVAVIAVHHTRKMTDDNDVFNEVSGSTGLTGAADGILVVKRSRNTAEGILHITGRDVNEHEYGLSWDAIRCSWSLLDEPAMVAAMASTRRKILDFVAAHEGQSPQDAATALNLSPATARQTMRRMANDDQLASDGEGRYFLPLSLSHLSPVSPASDSSDSQFTSPSKRTA